MAIPYKIDINLDGQSDIYTSIVLSTGDYNAYGLELEFRKNGQFYDITGYNLAVYAKRSGATVPIADVGRVEGGRGYYTIKPSMYSVSGDMQLEIVLTDNFMHHVTKVLHFTVRAGFSAGVPVDLPDWSVLTTLIQQGRAVITDAINAANYAYNAPRTGLQYVIAAPDAVNRERADLVLKEDDPASQINNAIEELQQARNGNTDIAIRIDFLGGTINVGEKTDGSAIVIPEGYDNIYLRGNGVKLTGEVYDPDYDKIYSVFTNNADNVIIDGFNIVNNASDYGYGLYNTGTNCTITGNTCSSSSGLYNTGTNCTITGNTCSGEHAGLYNFGTNCTITGNTCSGEYDGLSNTGNNCTITGNTCSGEHDGSGLCNTGTNCTIIGNTCSSSSGIGLGNSGNNCTIIGNTCSGGSGDGLSNTGTNCTITGNTCSGGGYGLYNTSTSTTDKCIITGNICLYGGISVKSGTCLPATQGAMADVNTGSVTFRP